MKDYSTSHFFKEHLFEKKVVWVFEDNISNTVNGQDANCFQLVIISINPFVPNSPFLYPLKTSENRKVFRCLQGVKKGCIGNERINSGNSNSECLRPILEAVLSWAKLKVTVNPARHGTARHGWSLFYTVEKFCRKNHQNCSCKEKQVSPLKSNQIREKWDRLALTTCIVLKDNVDRETCRFLCWNMQISYSKIVGAMVEVVWDILGISVGSRIFGSLQRFLKFKSILRISMETFNCPLEFIPEDLERD